VAREMIVVIPARLASTRLPNKPLLDLGGKPMVVRTYERALGIFPAEDIFVATDADEIVAVCERHGIQSIMTPSDLLTGTDRVAAVAEMIEAQTYINLQGDEPLFNPDDLIVLRDAIRANPGKIINGYCPITNAEQFASPMVPKVVFDTKGALLYMSRAPIPGSKSGAFSFGYRQVCAYGFPRASLRDFTSQSEKTPLEAVEDIEILRFTELGHGVMMVPMSDTSIAVDTPEDVEKVMAVINAGA
jgi:3-deoxy-manno-octulosonate cytidylyltransferase (CMP-KDO synthetase)